MSDECCRLPLREWRPEDGQPPCPQCESRGTLVESQTIKALLTPAAMVRYEVQSLYFCAASQCDTVYFSTGQSFHTEDIRVPVWQKEPVGARTVCYCFGENEADIQREIKETGASPADARVRAHIAARRCACEIRNPRGTCCLGDVIAAVKRMHATAAGTVTK